MIDATISRNAIEEAALYVKSKYAQKPQIGLVLGSGLSALAENVESATRIAFHEIPHFPVSTVEGHDGILVLGTLYRKNVLVMQGRVHFYEGYSPQEITFPIRVMQLLGVETLILTNAAGGINPNFQAGNLMLITDHLNLIGMSGFSPLRGKNDGGLGPRFPSMTDVYDTELRKLTLQQAEQLNIPLRQGVYAGLAGPAFETPAEIRFLRSIGADAVGMSTVSEATIARHGGMSVLGISMISNVAIDSIDTNQHTTHEEVIDTSKSVTPMLVSLLKAVLEAIPNTRSSK